MLENKNAVVYGGSDSVGSAVARAFDHEEANVFLAGRTLAKLDEVAEEIRSAGGVAETAQVDALDEHAVQKHADEVAEKAGRVAWRVDLGSALHEPLGGCRSDVRVHQGSRRGRDPGFPPPCD